MSNFGKTRRKTKITRFSGISWIGRPAARNRRTGINKQQNRKQKNRSILKWLLCCVHNVRQMRKKGDHYRQRGPFQKEVLMIEKVDSQITWESSSAAREALYYGQQIQAKVVKIGRICKKMMKENQMMDLTLSISPNFEPN